MVPPPPAQYKDGCYGAVMWFGHTNDYRYQYEILEYSTGLFVLDERSLTVPL